MYATCMDMTVFTVCLSLKKNLQIQRVYDQPGQFDSYWCATSRLQIITDLVQDLD